MKKEICNIMAIILNYNSFKDSKKCALSLKEQININLAITIVDNSSDNGEIDDLRKFCIENEILLIESDKNNGFSAGNNIGLKKAKQLNYKYAMVINPDVEIRDKQYISKCIEILNKDNKIAVLGTDIINMHGNHQNPMREVRYLEEVFWPFELIRNKLSKNIPYVGDYNKSGYCEKLSGCCFFVDINFIAEIGYLDENVFLYCEEPILASIVKMKKRKLYYNHKLTAYHMHKDSEKGNPKKRLILFNKSRKYYLNKYSGYKGLKLKLAIASRDLQKYMYMCKFK